MKRRLLNLLTVLSLLACGMFAVCSAVSYWVWFRADVGWTGPSAGTTVASDGTIVRLGSWPGHLHVYVFSISHADPPWWQWAFHDGIPDGGAHFLATGRAYGKRSSYRHRQFLADRDVRETGANPWTTPNGGAARRVVQWSVGAPYWFLAAVMAVPPLLWGRRAVRRRREAMRRRARLCPRCGYDLRATPGRCPECGEPVAWCAGGTG